MRLSYLLAALVALAASAEAQTCTTSWAAPVSGSWNTAANWTNGVPGADATACIQLAGTYTVTLASDQALAGLVLGGASGTQTLALGQTLTSLGGGTVGPNGRLDVLNSANCGSCDGLPLVLGTLTVEGTITHVSSTGLISQGGTLDIAPGGQLLANTSGGGTIGGSGVLSTLRVRGRVVFDPNGGPANDATLRPQLDIDGGTVDVRGGQVNVNSGGRLRNASFAVAAGADLRFSRATANVGDGTFVVEGTLSGDPQGTLQFNNGELRAGVGGATLAVGGAGLLLYNPSSLNFEMQSAGGAFLNTGLLRVRPNGLRIRQAVLENAGTIRVEGSSITLNEGAVVRNRAGGTVELLDGASFGDGDRTGRFENAGLLSTRLNAGTSGRSSLNERLRSQPGSELRIGAGTRLSLDLPASASLPAGVRVTGTGELSIASTEFFIEGEVSPGTEAQPVATLDVLGRLYFSRLAGSPRLVVDVDAGGQSDRIVSLGATGQGFPVRPFGTLVVRVRPGTIPQVGDTWTILASTRANQIQGTFTQIVAQDAPAGIAFVAEYSNTGASSITLRAVAVAPGGPITVSTDAPVGGGIRAIFLTGPGTPGVASARLDCTECLDAAAFGTIPAVVTGEGTLREARFDLTSPRIYGYYDLVVQRSGQPDVRVPITVRPFLSYVVMQPGITRGIGVRPAGLRYNWSALRVSNVTNADAPGYTVAAVDRQDGEQVAFALASGSRPFTESDPEQGPTRASLAFSRIPAGGTATLGYGQRMDPSEVLFPEQSPTGPDDRRIAFGDTRTVIGLTAQHASFDRTRALIADALQDADDAALAAFLTSAEAASPGSVSRGIGVAIDRPLTYVEGVNSLFERVLGEIGRTTPVPPGLGVSAAPAFDEALDAATGRYLVASFRALSVDIETAPTSVQALLDAEVAALGEDASRGGGGGEGGVCTPPAAPPGPPPSPPTGGGLLSSVGRLVRQVQAQGIRQQSVVDEATIRAIQGVAQSAHDACVTITDSAEERGFGQPPAGACSFPPLPPGGPPSGGGGGCGPPAAPADPNDKTALGQYRCEFGTVMVGGEPVTRCIRYFVPRADATAPIVYSVEFENLPQATANAEFVTITDVLDPSLDPSTLRIVATSSDSTFSHTVSGQTVTFRFVGIDLPPNVNQPEGQGFVTFSVQPRPGLADGTEIRNDASIVFDFNPPIVTPEVIHEIRETADLAAVVLAPDFQQTGQPFEVEVFVAHLQGDPALGASATITLPVTPLSVTTDIGTCMGTTVLTCTFETLDAGDVARVAISMPALALGEATIAVTAATTVFDAFTPNDRDAVVFPVVPVAGEETPDGFPTELTLAAPRPNPARAETTLRWGLPAAAPVDVRVFDLLGREVARVVEGEQAAAGWHETRLDASPLASGVYVVRIQSGTEVRTRRIVVIR